MVVRMRHTRAHTGNRRSHHFLKGKATLLCKDCGNAKLPHIACANCGKYKGRNVLNKEVKLEKKAKKVKAKKSE